MPPTARQQTARSRAFVLVLACFFFSGFAALLYQTAWTRELAFVFGAEELAVVVVLAAYMAGLALGAALGARLAERVTRPVLAYGLLELGIAGSALAVPLLLRLCSTLFASWFGGLPEIQEASAASVVARFALSFVVVGIPTTLMGATLPLLIRSAVRHDQQVTRRSGELYASNTAGAVFGTLAAAFVLLPMAGLESAIYVGVGTNMLVFGAAAMLSRASAEEASNEDPDPTIEERVSPSGLLILPLMTLSGAASFTYEVLWTRLFGYWLGGSVYAFATMLASFLLGIAIGSAAASRLGPTRAHARTGFAIAQVGAGVFALLAFVGLDQLALTDLQAAPSPLALLAQRSLICAALLLPSTLCIGATFPFAVRILSRGAADASRANARVYAWNTAGSIGGAIATGLFVLPALGFEDTLRVTCGLNLTLAVAALGGLVPRRPRLAATPALLLAALLAWSPAPPVRLFRAGPHGAPGPILQVGVGRTATVVLTEDRPASRWTILSNGLKESTVEAPGALYSRQRTSSWMMMLPTLARPDARNMLVVGLGGASRLDAVPPAIESVTIVEIEEEIVRANRFLSDRRAFDAFADPRFEVKLGDVRGSLLLSTKRYDAIVSQPSHPWTAGSANLYTVEFFELVRSRLREDGVFVQWMGLHFIDSSLYRTLLASLADVFAYVRVYQPDAGGLLFLSSNAPLALEQTATDSIEVSRDFFSRQGLRVAEDVAARLVSDATSVRAPADVQRNHDRDNRLAMESPRVAVGDALASDGFDFVDLEALVRESTTLDRPYLVRTLAQNDHPRRARRIVREIQGPLRELAQAWLELEGAKPSGALRRAETVEPSALDEAALEWREAIRLFARLQIGDRSVLEDPSLLRSESVRTVAHGLALEDSGEWQELASLDAPLAQTDRSSPLRPAILDLRAKWRAEVGSAAQAEQGLAFVEERLHVSSKDADLLVLRARLAQRCDRADETMSSIELLARTRKATRSHFEIARSTLARLSDSPRRRALERLLARAG